MAHQTGYLRYVTSYLVDISMERAILSASSPQPLGRVQPSLQHDVRFLVIPFRSRLIRHLSHNGEPLINEAWLLTRKTDLGFLHEIVDASVRQLCHVGHAAGRRDLGLSARDRGTARHPVHSAVHCRRTNVNRLIYLGSRNIAAHGDSAGGGTLDDVAGACGVLSITAHRRAVTSSRKPFVASNDKRISVLA